MAAGIYGFLPWRQKTAASQEARHRSRYMFALLATLSIILGLGSVLTLYLGEWAQQKQEKIKAEAHEYATIVVSRLNTEFKRMEDGVTTLAETNWLPSCATIPELMTTLKRSMPYWTATGAPWTRRSAISWTKVGRL